MAPTHWAYGEVLPRYARHNVRRHCLSFGIPRVLPGGDFVLTSQCLDRRIPDKQTLIDHRNANHTKADWQFTTKNARIKTQASIPFNLTELAD